MARNLVAVWHSRLPTITNWQNCNHCYGASFDGIWYAAAMWGPPVAREFNGRGYIELRRFAIAEDAPRNSASRMLSWMLREVRRQGFVLAISYQDTTAHAGTIYKASGWKIGGTKKNIGKGWQTRNRPAMQTTSDKIRWEFTLANSAARISQAEDRVLTGTNNMELFVDIAYGSDSADVAANDQRNVIIRELP